MWQAAHQPHTCDSPLSTPRPPVSLGEHEKVRRGGGAQRRRRPRMEWFRYTSRYCINKIRSTRGDCIPLLASVGTNKDELWEKRTAGARAGGRRHQLWSLGSASELSHRQCARWPEPGVLPEGLERDSCPSEYLGRHIRRCHGWVMVGSRQLQSARTWRRSSGRFMPVRSTRSPDLAMADHACRGLRSVGLSISPRRLTAVGHSGCLSNSSA